MNRSMSLFTLVPVGAARALIHLDFEVLLGFLTARGLKPRRARTPARRLQQ